MSLLRHDHAAVLCCSTEQQSLLDCISDLVLVGGKHRLHDLTEAHCILSQSSHVLLGIAQLAAGFLQKCHAAKSQWQLAK